MPRLDKRGPPSIPSRTEEAGHHAARAMMFVLIVEQFAQAASGGGNRPLHPQGLAMKKIEILESTPSLPHSAPASWLAAPATSRKSGGQNTAAFPARRESGKPLLGNRRLTPRTLSRHFRACRPSSQNFDCLPR